MGFFEWRGKIKATSAVGFCANLYRCCCVLGHYYLTLSQDLHTGVEYTNSHFWKQHPLERPSLRDKFFWCQIQKRKQTLGVAWHWDFEAEEKDRVGKLNGPSKELHGQSNLKRIRRETAWSKYSAHLGDKLEFFKWFQDHYIQGRFTQMVTPPGIQTYCMNELATPLHSVNSTARGYRTH